MDENEVAVIIGCLGALICMQYQILRLQWLQRRRGRGRGNMRWWVRPVNRLRLEQGFVNNLIREVQVTDHEEFFKNFRMWPEQFNWLLGRVQPLLLKKSRRQPLTPKLRLSLTLMYLAQGGSVHSLHSSFRVGKSTARVIINETCRAIWEVLQPIYLPELQRGKFESIAKGFMDKWQFPNCIGAIDGRHMRIKAPPLTGSEFHNYKGFFSIVLIAMCDANYKFSWIDVGQFGSISDGGVWANTDLAEALRDKEVDLPAAKPLPGRDEPFPHVIVGDEAFPLSTYLMRPYPGRRQGNLPDDQRIFNYRLSRARRCIENSFGILAARWQILAACMTVSPENADAVVKACVCLHNFLLDANANDYAQPALVDREEENGDVVPGQWRTEVNENLFRRLGRVGANRAADVAIGMRNYLKSYFVSETGSEQAPWQYRRAFRGQLAFEGADGNIQIGL